MFNSFINNIALLLALSICHILILKRWKPETITCQIVSGVLFGLIIIAGMMNPFVLTQGIIFDGRSLVISVAGLVCGPVSALITAVFGSIYLVGVVGGGGTVTGVLVLTTSAIIGSAYHFISRNNPKYLQNHWLYLFGLIVHVNMVLLMFTLPSAQIWKAISTISLPVLILFPIGTMILGRFLLDQIEAADLYESLKKSEEKYKNLVENANSMVFRLDPELNVIYLNEYAQSLTGYSSAELVGKSIFGTLVPEVDYSGADLSNHVQVVRANIEQFKSQEDENICKDGSRIWVNWANEAIRDENGELIEILSIGNDITEKRAISQALLDSEKQLRMVIDLVPYYIFAKNKDGRYILANKACAEAFGMTVKELIGKQHNQLPITAQDAAQFSDSDNLVFETGNQIFIPEAQITDLNGDIHFQQTTKIPFTPVGSTETAVLGIAIDITPLKQIEKKLRASEAHYMSLVENIPLQLFRKDLDGKFTYANPCFCEIFGISLDDLLGITDHDLFPKELADKYRSDDQKVIESKQLLTLHEENIDANRDTIYVEGFKTPIIDKNGAVLGIQGVFWDVTNNRKMEAQFLQAQKMESVGQLAGGVAHDFNNMLSVISGHCELAMMCISENDPLQDHLHHIQKASQRSAALTNQLLAFARKQTIDPVIVDLNLSIQNAIQMLEHLIGENIELLWKPASQSIVVKIDPTQLDQILVNLVVNARDAISGVGKVIISTVIVELDDEFCQLHPGSGPGDYVVLSICDSGCGMDEEAKERLFEPFYTTKEKGQGTGLGLSTVYGIVKQNHGFIDIESEVNIGSIFKIYLPRLQYDEVNIQARDPVQTKQGGGESILVVEDNEQLLEVSKAMLMKLGYQVLCANSPNAALEIANDSSVQIDLLLTDVIMPEMNGEKLFHKIHEIRPEMPCLFMSGYTDDVIADHGILNEGVNYISKPISYYALAAKLRKVIETS